MMNDVLLSDDHWRIFRLFLSELTDEELDGVEEQLEREQSARREREGSIARLFYSAMCREDLEAAQHQIDEERRGRAEDQRLIRESIRANKTGGKTRRRASRRR